MKFTSVVVLLATLFGSNAFAAVAKSHDSEKNCTLYQAIAETEDGRVVLSPGQVLHSSKRVYGLSFLDMEVDFDRQEVLVQPMMNIVMGFNRGLVEGKSIIRKDNPDFNFLINQLNRKINLFEKVCINGKNEIVYANYYPAPPQE